MKKPRSLSMHRAQGETRAIGKSAVLAAFGAMALVGCGSTEPGSERPEGDPLGEWATVSQALEGAVAIKGIAPGGDIAVPSNNFAIINEGRAERVIIATVWDWWESQFIGVDAAGLCPAGLVAYDGHCFGVRAEDDAAIRQYAAAGVKVTAGIIGTPPWAANPNCAQYGTISADGGQWWCAPANPADMARFAGFLASQYGAMIDSYVIGNEVNAAMWYDIGCGGPLKSFSSCFFSGPWYDSWVQNYAAVYNAAYDAIVSHQPEAHVIIPFTNHFFSANGILTSGRALSVKTSGLTLHKTFSGLPTSNGQWLHHHFTDAIAGVRFVKVYTRSSPSWVAWREVQALENNTVWSQGMRTIASSNGPGGVYAVDSNSNTAWNSGRGAPGSITVDLANGQSGVYRTLSDIKLQIEQNPAGYTTHEVYLDVKQQVIRDFPHLPAQDFILRLIPQLGPRTWRVAFHPYNDPAFKTTFSPEDSWITMGNVGATVGWLQKTYGTSIPGTNEVHLTEFGYSSDSRDWTTLQPVSTQATQATLVCDSLRNVLGTPGIASYQYTYFKDPGFGNMGLWAANGTRKAAWTVWAEANREDLPSCGYDQGPNTVLYRFYNASTARHWQSSRRVPPPGFAYEGPVAELSRAPLAGTHPLYECRVTFDLHNIITPDVNCENQKSLGPVGYAFSSQIPGTVPLVRCVVSGGWDHYVSTGGPSACTVGTYEGTLGYVYP